MLAKLTCRGRTFEAAVQKARRALLEFRIRGVSTNVGFLQAVLADPDFAAGGVTTSFIEDHPQLLTAQVGRDRAHQAARLPRRRDGQPAARRGAGHRHPGRASCPSSTARGPVPDGTRQLLREVGPEEFARRLRAQDRVAVTDTTFRDAHQSLLATRVRTRDLLAVADHVARTTPQLWSLECWGGATYDVALRFLSEDPWERLAALREAVPNIGLQMLLRGRNTVGYTPYPTEVTEAFVQEAAETGIDVFRIFDALNDVSQMRPAIDAVRATGTVGGRGRALLHRRPVLARTRRSTRSTTTSASPRRSSTPAPTCSRSRTWPGCCARRPRAPSSPRCASASTCRCTCTPTTPPAASSPRSLAAIDAGVDAVDAACAAMAGTTSQPALSALVSATDHSARETGLSLAAVNAMEPYWEAIRRVYAPFESGLPAPTGRVYRHEIPGGQLSNLRQQAIALGLGEKFEQVEDMYAAANDILGNVVKVTPSSKVVGDLALALVAAGADPAEFEADPASYDVPDSVIGFLSGELGDPPGGWPEPFRTKALAGRTWKQPTETLTPEQQASLGTDRRAHAQRAALPRPDEGLPRVARDVRRPVGASRPSTTSTACAAARSTASRCARAARCSSASRRSASPTSAASATSWRPSTASCARCRCATAASPPTSRPAEKADPGSPGHVAAPYDGAVTVTVAEGDTVEAGPDRRHHRGDEDGGLDHRARSPARSAARGPRHAGRRGRRPGAGAAGLSRLSPGCGRSAGRR